MVFDLGKMLGFTTRKLIPSSVNLTLNHPQPLKSRNTLFKLTSFLYFSTANCKTPDQSDSKVDTFTSTYLINSCGVTVADANRISKKFRLKSIEKPERVLKFFKTSGFSDAQIASIIRLLPSALLSDVEKTLKPKFDIFASFGGSNETVLRIISQCPSILKMSVEKKIVPALKCLKKVVGSNAAVLTILTRFHWLLLVGTENSLDVNVAILCGLGMPKLSISRFLMTNGYALLVPPKRFKEMAERALKMGFNPNKHNFGDAINSFAVVSKENWAYKVSIFKKWGWSDNDFAMAFVKQPRIMLGSSEKIDHIMDLLVNTIELEASVVAGCPYILLYSLENRISPRCSVVRHLLLNGFIGKEDYRIGYIMRCNDLCFFKTFVDKHVKIRSKLMTLYNSHQKKEK